MRVSEIWILSSISDMFVAFSVPRGSSAYSGTQIPLLSSGVDGTRYGGHTLLVWVSSKIFSRLHSSSVRVGKQNCRRISLLPCAHILERDQCKCTRPYICFVILGVNCRKKKYLRPSHILGWALVNTHLGEQAAVLGLNSYVSIVYNPYLDT